MHSSPAGLCRRRGFTLLELVLVIALAGVLAGIAIPIYRGYRERAMNRRAAVEIQMIAALVDKDRLDFNRVPDRIDHLLEPGFVDPWGQPYRYLNLQSPDPSVRGQARKDKNLVPLNSDYDLYSLGPDGRTRAPLTSPDSYDDILRANDGAFIGRGEDY